METQEEDEWLEVLKNTEREAVNQRGRRGALTHLHSSDSPVSSLKFVLPLQPHGPTLEFIFEMITTVTRGKVHK